MTPEAVEELLRGASLPEAPAALEARVRRAAEARGRGPSPLGGVWGAAAAVLFFGVVLWVTGSLARRGAPSGIVADERAERYVGSLADAPVTRDLVASVDAQWREILKARAAGNAWVDKKDFSGVYAAWKAGGPSDLLRAREALREWQARQGEREDLQWRLESLFAEMALDRGDAPAATAHLDASIAAYPDAAYDDPARLSKFQHLVNRRAWLLAESEGREAAMSYAAARLESDPRFRYFYLPPWEDRLGVEERARLRRRVVEAYRARAAAAPSRERAAEAERFARELEAETQDDVAGVPSRELQAGGDANKRYFLIGPTADARKPERGYGLVVVLPGGDGGAAFLPFVKRLAKQAVPEGYLVAQLVSVEWKPGQFKRLVWPTEKRPAEGMKFSTEEFVEAVVADVGTKHALDARHVFTLAWSSGGPAAYAVSLRKKKTVAGSFIAMSVFRPEGLPPLAEAKGHAYFLYHSKADAVCPYRMAEDAVKALQDQGAEVQLKAYEGGHGWTGPVYDDVRAGLRWLEEKSGK